MIDRRLHSPLTTNDISKVLQVDLSTVIHWCEQGKLTAYKTPGGHRRIHLKNFLEFTKEYQLPLTEEFLEKIQGNRKLVIADDEEEIRKLVSKALKKAISGVDIYEAQDGFEAGKLVAEHLPDLMILDLKMPGIDGFKVCSDIKNDAQLKQTKILAITGQNTEENKRRILSSGADDYLPKPFELDDLIKKSALLLEIEKKGKILEEAVR